MCWRGESELAIYCCWEHCLARFENWRKFLVPQLDRFYDNRPWVMISQIHTEDLAADSSPPSRQLLPVQIFVSEPEWQWQWCQSVILTKTVFTLKTSLSTEGHLEIMTQSRDPQTLFSLFWSSSVRNWLWTITVIENNITGRFIFFYFHHGQILRDLARLSPNVRNLSAQAA